MCLGGFMKGIQFNVTVLLSQKWNKIVHHTFTMQFLHCDLMAGLSDLNEYSLALELLVWMPTTPSPPNAHNTCWQDSKPTGHWIL